MERSQIESLLQRGIEAVKQGNRETARQALMQVVENDERNAEAWLWLSGVVDNPEDQKVCLENVLTIEPNNVTAAEGLEYLVSQQEREKAEPEDQSYDDWAKEQTKGKVACPYCGLLNPKKTKVCEGCGETIPPPGAKIKEPKAPPKEGGLRRLCPPWLAGMIFMRYRAYTREIRLASLLRMLPSILIGGVLILALLMLVINYTLGTEVADRVRELWAQVSEPQWKAAVVGIALAAIIVDFFMWAAASAIVSRLLGGNATFKEHSHSIAIAYAASGLASAVLIGIYYLLTSVTGVLPAEWHEIGAIVLISLIGLHFLIAHGQAISAAGRFKWFGGVTSVIVSFVLYLALMTTIALVAAYYSGLDLISDITLDWGNLFSWLE